MVVLLLKGWLGGHAHADMSLTTSVLLVMRNSIWRSWLTHAQQHEAEGRRGEGVSRPEPLLSKIRA